MYHSVISSVVSPWSPSIEWDWCHNQDRVMEELEFAQRSLSNGSPGCLV